MGAGRLDRRGQLAGGGGAQPKAVAVFGIEGGYEAGVVPVLDVVVRAVVDLDLDGVAVVVDQEDEYRQLAADHLRHLLRGQLERAVADQRQHLALRRGHRVAERGRHRPADVAPLHLHLETRTVRQPQQQAVEPRVAGLGDHRGVGRHQRAQLAHEFGPAQPGGRLGHRVRQWIGADARVLDHGLVAAFDLVGQGGQEIAQVDAAEVVAGQAHLFQVRGQYAVAAGHGCPADRGVVVEYRAQAEHAVGPVHHRTGAGTADLAPVGADVLRVILRKETLGRGHHRHRAAERLGQPHRFDLGAGGAQLAADQDHRLAPGVEEAGRGLDRGGERLCVAGFGLDDRADRAGRGARRGRQVAGDLDIGGLALAQRGTQRVVDQRRGILGRGDRYRRAGELAGDLQLVPEIVRAQGVV